MHVYNKRKSLNVIRLLIINDKKYKFVKTIHKNAFKTFYSIYESALNPFMYHTKLFKKVKEKQY